MPSTLLDTELIKPLLGFQKRLSKDCAVLSYGFLNYLFPGAPRTSLQVACPPVFFIFDYLSPVLQQTLFLYIPLN